MERQFVNFAFYRIDPAWRKIPVTEQQKARKEFLDAYKEWENSLILLSYTTQGIRAECDFFLWRISKDLESFQAMSSKMLATGFGRCLSTPYSYLSMTKRSTYVDKHQHQGQEGNRSVIIPGKAKYLFVYPFLKTRAWYLLPLEQRQAMMDEHIRVGHKYPSVKINTTYSFGLDDQEFVVAFESDKPQDFLDLVMELRATQGSLYTLRDTPIFTGIASPISDIVEAL